MYRNKQDRKEKILRLLEEQAGNHLVCFDVETTGLKKTDQIVEIAAKKYAISKDDNGFSFEQIDVLHAYIKPPFLMEEKVMELHGITNEFLQDKPVEKDIASQVEAFFQDVAILTAYNIKFDRKMTKTMFERCETKIPQIFLNETSHLDVLEFARDHISKEECKSHKQEDICKLMGLDEGIQFHSAIDDVEACFRLFKVFVKQYQSMKEPEYQSLHTPIILQDTRGGGICFWAPKERPKMKRIYLNTDCGSFFYDLVSKEWRGKDCDPSEFNMPALIDQAYALMGAKTEQEFVRKVTGKV